MSLIAGYIKQALFTMAKSRTRSFFPRIIRAGSFSCQEHQKCGTPSKCIKKKGTKDTKRQQPSKLKKECTKKIKKAVQPDWPWNCYDPLCPVVRRLDDYKYFPTNKKTRKFQKTWSNGPEIYYRKKFVCDNPFVEKLLPLYKRKIIPRVQCPSDTGSVGQSDSKCKKIILPNCKGKSVRNPPTRSFIKARPICEKKECPFPSFTECKKPLPNKKRPQECSCLNKRSLCEMYKFARQRGMDL